MNRTLPYSILSVLPAAAVYVFLFLAGPAPDRLNHTYVYVPILIVQAFGIFFSVLALSGSVGAPIDISATMRFSVLLAAIGIFANIAGVEYILGNTVFHAASFPPPS